MEDISEPDKNVTTYTIHKQTYSDGRAYRYRMSDDAGRLCYIAKRTGLLRPAPTRLVEFFDPDDNLSGRLQPPDLAPWLRASRYELYVGEEEAEAETEVEPQALIKETWNLVDILLLRLPRYQIQMGQNRYVIRGSRYSTHFYEIYDHTGEEEIEETPEVLEDFDVEATEVAEPEEPEEIDVQPLEELEEQFEEQLALARAEENKVGELYRPAAGPSYVIETDAAPLRQAPLVLAAIATLIDMELHS